jgi:hypothetical protein
MPPLPTVAPGHLAGVSFIPDRKGPALGDLFLLDCDDSNHTLTPPALIG